MKNTIDILKCMIDCTCGFGTHFEAAVRWVRENIKNYKECEEYNNVK